MLIVALFVALFVALLHLQVERPPAAARRRAWWRLLSSERGWNPIPDFKGIANAMGAVFDAIKGFVSDAVDFVHLFGQLAVNAVVDGATALTDLVTWFGTVFVNTVIDAASAAKDLLTWFGTVFINTITDTLGAVQDLLTWFGTVFVNIVTDVGGAIRDLVTWFGTIFVNTITGGFGNIQDLLTWFGTLITNAATGAGSGLVDGVTWLGTHLVNGITDAAGAVVDRIQVVADGVLHVGERVGTAIEGVGEKAVTGALDHKDEILAALLGGPAGLILEELFKEHPDLKDKLLHLIEDSAGALDEAGRAAAETVFSHLGGVGHVEPEEAPGLAAALFAVQAGAGAALHAVALTKDAVPFLPNDALTYMMAFLGKFTGWEQGVGAIFGPTVKGAIGRPFEYLVNRQTTSAVPGEGPIGELFGRRHIDAADFDEGLARHGLSSTWRTAIGESSYAPLRKFELKMIADAIDLPENVLQGFLEDARYRPEAIPYMITALHAAALKSANGKLISEVFTARQNGYIDAGQFAAGCAAAGISDTEIGVWSLAADAAYNNAVKSELVSVWRSAAGRNAMTDDELRAALAMIGISGNKQDIEVLRAQAARLKKPIGVGTAAHDKALAQTRTELTTAYRLQFRKGLITADDLHAQLVAIGYEDFQAAAMVELAQAEAYTPPKVSTQDTPEAVSARARADLEQAYITQFAHDAIDALTLKTDLIAIGVNDFEASALVAKAQAQKVQSPTVLAQRQADKVAAQVQTSLEAAYTEQFAKGYITGDEYESDLVAIGVAPAVASAKRLLAESKALLLPGAGALSLEEQHARQLQAAQKAAAIEEFRKGILNDVDLGDALVAAGIAPDVAAAIVETEVARKFKPATVAGP